MRRTKSVPMTSLLLWMLPAPQQSFQLDIQRQRTCLASVHLLLVMLSSCLVVEAINDSTHCCCMCQAERVPAAVVLTANNCGNLPSLADYPLKTGHAAVNSTLNSQPRPLLARAQSPRCCVRRELQRFVNVCRCINLLSYCSRSYLCRCCPSTLALCTSKTITSTLSRRRLLPSPPRGHFTGCVAYSVIPHMSFLMCDPVWKCRQFNWARKRRSPA